MKKQDKQELRKKDITQLNAEFRDASDELVKARISLSQGKLKNVHKISTITDDIAVIKTIIRQKQMEQPKDEK